MVIGNGNSANMSWEGDAVEYRQVPRRILIQKAWGKQPKGRGLLASFLLVKRNHLSKQGLKTARVRECEEAGVYS